MSDTDTFNLIRLVRLLDSDLSTAEAFRLRKQIAASRKLSNQYRRLRCIGQQAAIPNQQLKHTTDISAHGVASFVEGRMKSADEADFEYQCWNSDGLLREVLFTWRAEHQDRFSPPGNATAERVNRVVGLLSERLQESSESSVKNRKRRSRTTPKIVRAVTASRSKPAQWWSGYHTPTVWFVTGAVSAAIVAAVVGLQRSGPDQTNPAELVQQSNPENKIRSEGNDTRPAIGGHDEERQSESLKQWLPQKLFSGAALQGQESQVVRKDQSDVLTRQPATLAASNVVVRPSVLVKRRFLVNWSDVRGIAGVKKATDVKWSGIQHQSVSQLWTSKVRSQLLTLAASRVTGEAIHGTEVIADENSFLEIAALREPGSREPTEDQSVILSCDVRFGRVAFRGLRKGQKLALTIQDQRLTIEAVKTDTTVTIERSSLETLLAIHRGKTVVEGQTLTPRSWGRIDSDGVLSLVPSQKGAAWFLAVSEKERLPRELCDTFNASTDLLAVAGELRQDPQPITGYVAAQVALQYSVSEMGEFPEATLRQIALSDREIQRVALIEYLVSRFRIDVSSGDALLSRVCRLQQVNPTTVRQVNEWFAAASKTASPTLTQLSELTKALRPAQPLFVRQCAKLFLQKILGEPLAEYDPARPSNRQALKLVTSKIRKWQQVHLNQRQPRLMAK